MMQNRNGPCPLLALANVLLLRNRITLPTNTTSISQVSPHASAASAGYTSGGTGSAVLCLFLDDPRGGENAEIQDL